MEKNPNKQTNWVASSASRYIAVVPSSPDHAPGLGISIWIPAVVLYQTFVTVKEVYSMNNPTRLLQLTPALTDFKGPAICICYRRISVIVNIENMEKHFKGFPLLVGPL